MAKKLTAAALNGAASTDEYEFEMKGETYSVVLRPLTNAEQAKVQSKSQGALTLRSQEGRMVTQPTPASKIMESTLKGNVLAIQLAMVDPELSEQEIMDSELPVEDISKRIKELSGMATSDVQTEDKTATDFNEGAEFPRDEESGE